MISLKKILVPTDFSEHSSKAVTYGAELATKFGAELHLLHAVETTPIAYGEEAAFFPPESTAELEAAAAEELDKLTIESADVFMIHLPLGVVNENALRLIDDDVILDAIKTGTRN